MRYLNLAMKNKENLEALVKYAELAQSDDEALERLIAAEAQGRAIPHPCRCSAAYIRRHQVGGF